MAQSPVKLLTFNCNGLNSKIKSKRILTALLRSQADIIYLQETHLRTSHQPVFKTHRFPIQLQAPGSSKARGMAVLISSKLRVVVQDQMIDPEGRFLFANVHIKGEPFILASLYAPNENPLAFLDNCLASLQQFSRGPLIVGGYLNRLMNPRLDCSGPRSAKGATSRGGGRISLPHQTLVKFQLHDIWQCQHPKERDYNFFSGRHSSHSSLDYILVSSPIVQNFIDTTIGLRFWSDHAWVEAMFYLRNYSRLQNRLL